MMNAKGHVFLGNILFLLSVFLFLPQPLPAQQEMITISGTVMNGSGRGIDGIQVTFFDGETTQSETTAEGGHYSHFVYSGWAGTVTPNDPCYSFNPASSSLGPISSDTVANFTAAIYSHTISGIVSDGPPIYSGDTLLNPALFVTFNLSTGGSTLSGPNGAYSFTVDCGWSGTITPVKVGWEFNPASRFYEFVSDDVTGENYVGTALSTEYTISGRVTDESGRVEFDGVEIQFFDGVTLHTETTSGGGYYSYSVPIGWTGTVTPNLAGYTFSPVFATVGPILANTTRNFTAALNSYTISGTVLDGSANPISQVSLALSTGATAMTNTSGQYAFQVPHGWSGNLTPSRTAWSFNPVYRSYTNVQTDAPSENFIGKPEKNQYTISGTVTAGEVPLANVILNGLPGNPLTSASGFYFATVSQGWTGTVTPALSGYTFIPSSRAYTSVNDNSVNENYEAQTNDLPDVKIVSPPDNAFVNGEVIIKTEASDSDGIGKVELFIDDQKVAEFLNVQDQAAEVDRNDLAMVFKKSLPAFQADGYGNVYSIISQKDGKTALIRQKDPSRTEILLEDDMSVSGWLVKPDGTVIIAGTTIATGENWIMRIGSMKETPNTTDPRVDIKWNLTFSDPKEGGTDLDEVVMNPAGIVFTCKYIWDTSQYAKTSHQVKAIGYDTQGQHAQDENTLTVSSMKLLLQLDRDQEKAWIITRQYVKIEATVENPESLPIEKYVIYRKAPNGEFLAIGEIGDTQITDNSFTFYDKDVAENITYSYKIEALDERGIAIGASEEKSI